MNSSMVDIAILIPVYNRINITKIGLNAIFESLKYYNENNDYFEKLLRINIIVIDDGSLDNTGDWIEQNYKEVKVL